jgi:hypothetical protein
MWVAMHALSQQDMPGWRALERRLHSQSAARHSTQKECVAAAYSHVHAGPRHFMARIHGRACIHEPTLGRWPAMNMFISL